MARSPALPVSTSAVGAAIFAALLFMGGCASTAPPAAPSPDEIPALEKALARDSSDLTLRARLGEAYRRAERPEAARLVLEPAAQAGNPAAMVFLGLTYEDLGRLEQARKLYQSFLQSGADDALASQVRARLVALQREELRRAVQAAVSREQELASTTPAPRTVGVFPFLTVSDDPQLEPLGRALAALLTTDLAQTDRLRVLERERVQFLLDEIRLGESGRVDPRTAARAGHMLGAGRLVQGRVEGGENAIDLQAVVVPVPGATDSLPPVLREQDPLDRIFEMEHRLALAVYQAMGIQLTPAERERVTARHTDNVQALLAFGYGLEAQDAGRYAEAADQFRRAAALDPNFQAAQQHLQQAQELALAPTPAALGQVAVNQLPPPPPGLLNVDIFAPVEALIPDLSGREPVAEALGVEGTGRQGTAEIIIRPPGGGQ